jgi:RNA polymerase sigma-70 factor, ECF subfamily
MSTREAFEAAYEEHVDALFSYCAYKVSDREAARDLVQEAFMKTWSHIAGGGTVDNFKPFLYRILHNLIIDYYRKRKSLSLDALAEEGFDPGEDETGRLEAILDGTRAAALLRQLPEDYGSIVFMRYIQEMSLEEIAEATGLSKNAATVRVHRGLQKLKSLFNHE